MNNFFHENIFGLIVAGVGALVILIIFGKSAFRVAIQITKSAIIGLVITAVVYFGALLIGHPVSLILLSGIGLVVTVISFFLLPKPDY